MQVYMFPSLMRVAALLFLCCLSLASFFLAGMSNSSVMRLYTAQRRKSHLTSH